jgi:hypothetical protein
MMERAVAAVTHECRLWGKSVVASSRLVSGNASVAHRVAATTLEPPTIVATPSTRRMRRRYTMAR